jgi:hypothetical protein
MFQLIATSICFFNILSTTPMCFTNAQAPLIFDTKGECNKTVNNIIKVINEPLTNKDVGIVFKCQKIDTKETVSVLYSTP